MNTTDKVSPGPTGALKHLYFLKFELFYHGGSDVDTELLVPVCRVKPGVDEVVGDIDVHHPAGLVCITRNVRRGKWWILFVSTILNLTLNIYIYIYFFFKIDTYINKI